MKRTGLTLVEALVALAVASGLAFLAAQSLVRGWLAARDVVDEGRATQTLSQGLEYVRQRLESRPTGVVASAQGGVAVYQRWNTVPWVPLGLVRGDTTYLLPENPGGQDGDLYLLLDPGTGQGVLLTRQALVSDGSAWRLQTSCASPFSGLAYLYRLYPVVLVEGSVLGNGARADGLYLSEGGDSWRVVAVGLSRFSALPRYRAADGEVKLSPSGALSSQGIYLPYVEIGGKGFYLEDLVLTGKAGSRDYQVAAFLGHFTPSERLRALVDCGSRGSPPNPATGDLEVRVTGLPSGVAARVQVTGPGGFSQSLSATGVLSVPPGTYAVSAEAVDHGGETYVPAVEGSPVRVTAGDRAVVTVSYTAGGGTLVVSVEGYPQGADRSELVYEGPSRGGIAYTASGTYSRVLPAGTYTLSVNPGSFRLGETFYEAAPSLRDVVVPRNGEARVRVAYRAVEPGTLRVVIRGLPEGASADVRVVAPDGSEWRLTAGGDLLLSPDSYQVRAFAVTFGAVYVPTPDYQEVQVQSGQVFTAYVNYASGGRLRVEVSGLPQDPGQDVVRVYGPSSTALFRALRATWEGEVPVGTYQVQAGPLFLGLDRYEPTVTGSPARVDPGGQAVVRVAYARVQTAPFRVVLRWSGFLAHGESFRFVVDQHCNPYGHCSGTSVGGYHRALWEVASPSDLEAQLPVGHHYMTIPQLLHGEGYGVLMPLDVSFYPCKLPHEQCSLQQSWVLPRDYPYHFSLTESGGTFWILGTPAYPYPFVSPRQFRVSFCFPQNLTGKQVRVSFTQRGYDGTRFSGSSTRGGSYLVGPDGCSVAQEVFDQALFGYPGFALSFGDVVVDGVTYRPLIREVRGLTHTTGESVFRIHYRPLSNPSYAWYRPQVRWEAGFVAVRSPLYEIKARKGGEELVVFTSQSSPEYFYGENLLHGLKPELLLETSYAYSIRELPNVLRNQSGLYHVRAFAREGMYGAIPTLEEEVALSPGDQDLGGIDLWEEVVYPSGTFLRKAIPVRINLQKSALDVPGAVYVWSSNPYRDERRPASQLYGWWNPMSTLPPGVMGQVAKGEYEYRLHRRENYVFLAHRFLADPRLGLPSSGPASFEVKLEYADGSTRVLGPTGAGQIYVGGDLDSVKRIWVTARY